MRPELVKAPSGAKFNALTVIGPPIVMTSATGIKRKGYNCVCDCGKRTQILRGNLIRGLSLSCGCRRVRVSTDLNASHRKSKDRIYKIWSGMLVRARGKASHHSYADRGIGVCQKWLTFENFYEDMGDRPSERMTLERIDNNKDYSPDNCVWADRTVQARNRRNTVFVKLWGETRKLAQVVDDYGLSYKAFYLAYRRGYNLENFIVKHKTK